MICLAHTYVNLVKFDSKKTSLEQEYIKLLEKRVAQLQKLVDVPLEVKSRASDSAGDRDADPNDTENAAVASLAAPLTKENLSKVPDNTAKTAQAETVSAPTQGNSRVRQVISRYNAKSGLREETPTEEAGPKESGAETDSYLRDVMDPSDKTKLLYSEVDLGPGTLLDLLREVMPEYSTVQTSRDSRIFLFSPYLDLVHNWDNLKEAQNEQPDDTTEKRQARKGLGKILDHVQGFPGLVSYFKNRKSYLESGVIEYKHIWTLFPPGTEVVSTTFMDQQHILIVDSAPFPDEETKKAPLWCWYYDHDGTEWVVVEVEIGIEKFQGIKPVSSLPCYPLRYHKQKNRSFDLTQFKDRLVERGKDFERLCSAKQGMKQMFDYKAPVLTVEKPFRNQYSANDMVDGRIIVDPGAFLEHAPRSMYDIVIGEREADFVPTPDKKYDIFARQKYLIAPPRVLGWSTQRKSWCEFDISRVEEAKMANSNVFEKELQLDEDMKRMIKALVKHHSNKDDAEGPQNPDLIEGKGRGLVILLHGPPGLTAEAISEETRRPLLIVSVAEIGLNASRAERNLERLFQLASRWEAVLLVDEADVFLESRVREADPNRNALVSGIMILTTNRIKSLDVAVQSRIHLAVRYDDLSSEQMLHIFKSILSKFRLKTDDYKDVLTYWTEFAGEMGLKLNGRQIRNLVSSAQAMALSNDRDTINLKDIKQVMKVTRLFQAQLKDLVQSERQRREVSKEGD
ncbi:MAG: hypothetical protein Q9164_005791 [Protoblastenia rupestris]